MRLAVAVGTFLAGMAPVACCAGFISWAGRGCESALKDVGKGFNLKLSEEFKRSVRRDAFAREFGPTLAAGLVGVSAPVGPSPLHLLTYDALWRAVLDNHLENTEEFWTPLFIRE